MRISTAQAEHIRKVAKKMGYHPNQIAISLRTGQTKTLGLIVENIADNFMAALAGVIEDESKKHGYRVVYCSTKNDTERGRELIRMLDQRRVDGFIIVPTEGMEEDIQQLVAHKRPVILIDRYFPGIDVSHVMVSNFESSRLAVRHLVDQGYRQIGFITVDFALVQMQERERGYRKGLQESKIPFRKKNILKVAYDLNKPAFIAAIKKFIESNPAIDALFFATHYLGIAGLEAIRELGLVIPNDKAVICFDEHDIFTLAPPGITAIEQPTAEIGAKAIELLIDALENPHATKTKKSAQITATLHKRGSTRAKSDKL